MGTIKRLTGVGVNTAAITGPLFVALMTIDQGWRTGVPAGVALGIAFGIAVFAFESVWGLVAGRLRDHPSFSGETVIKTGEVREVVGIESVLGWLYLTNKALHFRSPSNKWSVALAHVVSVEAVRVVRFIPSGISIVTDGTSRRLVTDDDQGWVNAVSSRCRGRSPGPG